MRIAPIIPQDLPRLTSAPTHAWLTTMRLAKRPFAPHAMRSTKPPMVARLAKHGGT
jgi:hypothetical protein